MYSKDNAIGKPPLYYSGCFSRQAALRFDKIQPAWNDVLYFLLNKTFETLLLHSTSPRGPSGLQAEPEIDWDNVTTPHQAETLLGVDPRKEDELGPLSRHLSHFCNNHWFCQIHFLVTCCQQLNLAITTHRLLLFKPFSSKILLTPSEFWTSTHTLTSTTPPFSQKMKPSFSLPHTSSFSVNTRHHLLIHFSPYFIFHFSIPLNLKQSRREYLIQLNLASPKDDLITTRSSKSGKSSICIIHLETSNYFLQIKFSLFPSSNFLLYDSFLSIFNLIPIHVLFSHFFLISIQYKQFRLIVYIFFFSPNP